MIKSFRILCVAFVISLFYFGGKSLIVPYLPDLPVSSPEIFGIEKVLEILELVAFFVLMGSLVIDHIFYLTYAIIPPQENTQQHESPSKWLDLLYVFVLIIGSGGFLLVLPRILQ